MRRKAFLTLAAGAIYGLSRGKIPPIEEQPQWVLMDGGVLDLGIVRDCTLVAQNDYQIFGETWQGITAPWSGRVVSYSTAEL